MLNPQDARKLYLLLKGLRALIERQIQTHKYDAGVAPVLLSPWQDISDHLRANIALYDPRYPQNGWEGGLGAVIPEEGSPIPYSTQWMSPQAAAMIRDHFDDIDGYIMRK